jgi:hypothetical protein
MRFLLSGLLLGSLITNAHAQTPLRYSVGIGIERMGLDAPDGLGTRLLLGVGRHLMRDRLLVLASTGYGWADYQAYLGVNDFYLTGKTRQRFTFDATAAFDLIRHPRHALRVGAGPSLWYRREELLDGARFTITSQNQIIIRETYWRPVSEFNYGFNALVEYELALTSRLLFRVNTKFVSLKQAGQNTLYGGGVAYRLN